VRIKKIKTYLDIETEILSYDATLTGIYQIKVEIVIGRLHRVLPNVMNNLMSAQNGAFSDSSFSFFVMVRDSCNEATLWITFCEDKILNFPKCIFLGHLGFICQPVYF
jgi:hypothetical protein